MRFTLNTSEIFFEEECKLKEKKGKKQSKDNKKTAKSRRGQGSNLIKLILSDSKGMGTSIVLGTNSVQMLVKFCVKIHLTHI